MSRLTSARYVDLAARLLMVLEESEVPIPKDTLQKHFPEAEIKTLKKWARQKHGKVILGTSDGQAVPPNMTPPEFESVVTMSVGMLVAITEILQTATKQIKGERGRLQLENGFEDLMDAVDEALVKVMSTQQELVATKVEIGILLDRFFGDKPELTDGEE